MVVFYGHSRPWAWNGLPLIHTLQYMLARTYAITNEVLEPIMFVVAYPTVFELTCEVTAYVSVYCTCEI